MVIGVGLDPESRVLMVVVTNIDADDVKADLSFLLPRQTRKTEIFLTRPTEQNWSWKHVFFVCVPLKLFKIITYAEFSRLSFSFLTTIL